MKISPERHKAEIRRAVNDEKLGCIAERLVGFISLLICQGCIFSIIWHIFYNTAQIIPSFSIKFICRLSGGADTEWAWALEGRRVVPLMPRLVRPTLFTSLATSVSKAVAQNPRICLNQTPISSNTGKFSVSAIFQEPEIDILTLQMKLLLNMFVTLMMKTPYHQWWFLLQALIQAAIVTTILSVISWRHQVKSMF